MGRVDNICSDAIEVSFPNTRGEGFPRIIFISTVERFYPAPLHEKPVLTQAERFAKRPCVIVATLPPRVAVTRVLPAMEEVLRLPRTNQRALELCRIFSEVEMKCLRTGELRTLIQYAIQVDCAPLLKLVLRGNWTFAELNSLIPHISLRRWMDFTDTLTFTDPAFSQFYIEDAVADNLWGLKTHDLLRMMPAIAKLIRSDDVKLGTGLIRSYHVNLQSPTQGAYTIPLTPTMKYCLATATKLFPGMVPDLGLPSKYVVDMNPGFYGQVLFDIVPRHAKRIAWAELPRGVTEPISSVIAAFVESQMNQVGFLVHFNLEQDGDTVMNYIRSGLIDISSKNVFMDYDMEDFWQLIIYLAQSLDILVRNGAKITDFTTDRLHDAIEDSYTAAISTARDLTPEQLLHRVEAGLPPVVPMSVFSPFLSEESMGTFTTWTMDALMSAEACYSAFFQGTGFYEGRVVPLRWLTGPEGKHHGLRPIRHRLVCYLVPNAKSRDVANKGTDYSRDPISTVLTRLQEVGDLFQRR